MKKDFSKNFCESDKPFQAISLGNNPSTKDRKMVEPTMKICNEPVDWFNLDITHLLMFIGKELGVGNTPPGNTPPGNSSNLLQKICDKYPEICKPLNDLIDKRRAIYEFYTKLRLKGLNNLEGALAEESTKLQDVEENAVKELREVFDSIKKNLS